MSQQTKRSNKESEIQKILAALIFNDKDLLKKNSLTKTKSSQNSESDQSISTSCSECLEKTVISLQENYFVCPHCHKHNHFDNQKLKKHRRKAQRKTFRDKQDNPDKS